MKTDKHAQYRAITLKKLVKHLTKQVKQANKVQK